jgi:AcrR family transcriptional regulator
MKKQSSVAAKGRPRSFNVDKSLEAALQVFWRKGYEGASVADLTAAMAINRPSLYAAFGDKEALFRKVLERYESGPVGYIRRALQEPTARLVVARLLRGSADFLGDPSNPRGCLLVQGALDCGDEAKSVRQQLIQRRQDGVVALRRRLREAKAAGDLPRNSDPSAMASYIFTMIHGMAVQAASGASRTHLRKVADTAMRAWPQ